MFGIRNSTRIPRKFPSLFSTPTSNTGHANVQRRGFVVDAKNYELKNKVAAVMQMQKDTMKLKYTEEEKASEGNGYIIITYYPGYTVTMQMSKDAEEEKASEENGDIIITDRQ
jgi:hypothetical protein